MLDHRIAGLRDIAAELRTSTFQVLRWACVERPSRPLTERYRDPMRLRSQHGVLFIRRSRLEAWRNRNQRDGAGEKRLHGWADICAFTGMRRSAAVEACDWRDDPLPVVRPEGQRVWAYASALTDWCEAHEFAYGVHRLVSEARKLSGDKTQPRWRKRIRKQRRPEEIHAETARVGVAHVPEENHSQGRGAASSRVSQRPDSRGSGSSLSALRRYDESGIAKGTAA